MTADLARYLALITSEHRDKPRFVASVSASVQGLADAGALAMAIPPLFDLDAAVGAQLDVIGLWVGLSRNLSTPLTGVYFSYDTAGLGLDEGTILGAFDPTDGLVALPDDSYRVFLRAAIAANQWDGTIPGIYDVWANVFPSGSGVIDFEGSGPIVFTGSGAIDFVGFSSNVLVQDNQDMTMYFVIVHQKLTAVEYALITGGYIKLKPAGVRLYYVVSSIDDSPIFGLDALNDNVSGLDVGAWGTFTETA